MRIVFLLNHFPPIIDGVGDYTFELATELVRRGHEIHIICREKVPSTMITAGMHLHPIVPHWGMKGLQKAARKIIELQADWTVLQYVPYSFQPWGAPGSLIALWLYLRWRGLRLGVFFHEIKIKVPRRWSKQQVLGSLMAFIANALHLLSHRTMTSNAYYRSFFWTNRARIAIIRIGSNIARRLVDPQELKATQKQLGIADDSLVIGFFGTRLRGLEVLVPTLSALEGEGWPVQLMIMGKVSASEQRQLEEQARDLELQRPLLFTGPVTKEEASLYLNLYDIYLMLQPTHSNRHWTGTGTKSGSLAAGLMMGLPVIGTQGEMNDQFFTQTNSVQLLERLDVPSLQHAISSLIKNPERKKEWGDRAQKAYDDYLSIEQVAQGYLTELTREDLS